MNKYHTASFIRRQTWGVTSFPTSTTNAIVSVGLYRSTILSFFDLWFNPLSSLQHPRSLLEATSFLGLLAGLGNYFPPSSNRIIIDLLTSAWFEMMYNLSGLCHIISPINFVFVHLRPLLLLLLSNYNISRQQKGDK